MVDKLKRLYDNFVTSGMSISELDSKKLRQIRLINLITLWLSMAVFVLYLASHQLAISNIKPLLLLSIAAAAGILLFLRKTHNIVIAGHLTLLNLAGSMYVGNLLIGGLTSPAILWLFMVPVTAAVIVSSRALLGYLALTFFMAISLYFFSTAELIPFFPIAADKIPQLEIISYATELFIITFSLYHLVQEKNHYEQFLERTNQRLRQKNDKYHFMAHHDELTNLANRASFNKEINRIAQSELHPGENITVFFIDLDKLKQINDSHGHEVGDAVLHFVGKRIQRCFRHNDMIARIGGDEFAAVIIESKCYPVSNAIAKRIIEESKTVFQINELRLPITLSIGIASYPEHGKSIEDVLKKADDAMYSVKQSGRNSYAYYK